MYNYKNREDCNLNFPLWKIIRASTAAPIYFKPERIPISKDNEWFIDGCVSPYNNPSVIAFLTATLPEFNLNWETGEDKLLLISVSIGLAKRYPMQKKPNKMHIAQQAEFAFNRTIDSQVMHEDLFCRLWGRCFAGSTIDSEIGDQQSSNLLILKLFISYRHLDNQEEGRQWPHRKRYVWPQLLRFGMFWP